MSARGIGTVVLDVRDHGILQFQKRHVGHGHPNRSQSNSAALNKLAWCREKKMRLVISYVNILGVSSYSRPQCLNASKKPKHLFTYFTSSKPNENRSPTTYCNRVRSAAPGYERPNAPSAQLTLSVSMSRAITTHRIYDDTVEASSSLFISVPFWNHLLAVSTRGKRINRNSNI